MVDIRNIWAAIPIPRPSSLTQFCQPNHAERQAALAAQNMQPPMPSARLFVLQHGHFGDSVCVCVCVSGLPSHAASILRQRYLRYPFPLHDVQARRSVRKHPSPGSAVSVCLLRPPPPPRQRPIRTAHQHRAWLPDALPRRAMMGWLTAHVLCSVSPQRGHSIRQKKTSLVQRNREEKGRGKKRLTSHAAHLASGGRRPDL